MNYSLEAPFGNPHGKLSKKNCQIVWAENRNGTRFTQVRNRNNHYAPTAAEQACRTKFKQASVKVNEIMSDINQLEPYRLQWRRQINMGNSAYRTLRGYIFAKVYHEL